MQTQRTARRTQRLLILAGVGVVLLLAGAVSLVPSGSPGPGRLVFGVAPGNAPSRPGEAAKTMAALRELKVPGKPLVVHLYSGYTGPRPWARYRALLGRELAVFERAGFDIELVLRFAPLADRGSPRDVRAFVALVRRIVGAFGGDRRFTSVQITNEADRSASAASDGYFNRGDAAWQALIRGVIAAKATIRARHFGQLKVGFNYASAIPAFWRYLGRYGGSEFRRSVDWVGIDTYPGTLTPLDTRRVRPGIARAISRTLSTTRHVYMPLAGIPGRVAIHLSENGFATGAGHTYAMQATALESAVQTVASLSRTDRITEYDWFELRDGSGGTANRFGLLTKDYRPKPAFFLYRRLIRDLG